MSVIIRKYTYTDGSRSIGAHLEEEFDQVYNQQNINTTDTTTALANADTALTTANTALTTSNTAITTANGANTKADAAVVTANSANTTANTASINATAAVGTANTAKTTAETVQADYAIQKPIILQAVIDVADKASMPYVDSKVQGLVLGQIPNYITFINPATLDGDVFTYGGLRREDNTLAIDFTLSNKVNGQYLTKTYRYYDVDGITVLSTKVRTLTYYNNGTVVEV